MRGNPPSIRDLKRERLVGNWGGASEHIGRRWEEVGLDSLQCRVASAVPWPANGYRPDRIVSLAGDKALQLALSRCGLPSPDVIMVLRDPHGSEALQALDFKWNLEFASYGQIRAEAIQALLKRGVALLKTLMAEKVGEHPEELPVLDGVLCAPILPVNQWFLNSEDNLQQEYPIEPREVIFEETDPIYFFGDLPGWDMAALLARADRSEGKLQNLEGAEHYYRTGAGLWGAVTQFLVSVFVRQPPPITAEVAFDWLKGKVRPPSSTGFVQAGERLMGARNQLQTRLRALVRSPYRFSDLAEALRGRGLQLPEREDGLPPKEREQWGVVLRKVAVEHKELIYRTGLRLVEAGLSDPEALARLEADPRRFADRARAHADKLIAATLGQGN